MTDSQNDDQEGDLQDGDENVDRRPTDPGPRGPSTSSLLAVASLGMMCFGSGAVPLTFDPLPGGRCGPSGNRMKCIGKDLDGNPILQDRRGQKYLQTKKGIRKIKNEE